MSRRHAALAVPLGAGALALVWWSSSSSPTDVISQARTTFGTEPVVHVVALQDLDPNGPAMRPITSSETVELWYDASRGRTHLVLRRGTKVALDVVDHGLEPHGVAPVANVSAGLWEFVTGYRSALADAGYALCGSARIEGRRVLWLCSQMPFDGVDVAVDPATYQPLWLRSDESTGLTQLSVAETKPYDRADFLTAKQRKPRHL